MTSLENALYFQHKWCFYITGIFINLFNWIWSYLSLTYTRHKADLNLLPHKQHFICHVMWSSGRNLLRKRHVVTNHRWEQCLKLTKNSLKHLMPLTWQTMTNPDIILSSHPNKNVMHISAHFATDRKTLEQNHSWTVFSIDKEWNMFRLSSTWEASVLWLSLYGSRRICLI